MPSSLIPYLPPIRGRYRSNVLMSQLSWIKSGGPAAVLYTPDSLEDLVFFVKKLNKRIPYHIVGMGSNILVRDTGLEGVTVRVGRSLSHVVVDGYDIHVGAGYLDRTLAHIAGQHNIGGFEFFAGIPGTIGGALATNAGCYGTEICDILVHADVLDPHGRIHRFKPKDLGYTYRHCSLPKRWMFLGARLRGYASNQKRIMQKVHELVEKRKKTQPSLRTAGSLFKNSPCGSAAWKLIDAAGCRGWTVGDAALGEKHCNFLINKGKASSQDLEILARKVHQAVKEKTGVVLEWEMELWGDVSDIA